MQYVSADFVHLGQRGLGWAGWVPRRAVSAVVLGLAGPGKRVPGNVS